MYRDNNRPRRISAASNVNLPNVTAPSPDFPFALPGEPNPANKPGLIPLFQYISNLYQQYLENNVDVGYIKVYVSSSKDETPIPDVKITLSKPMGNDIFLSQLAHIDSTGQTAAIPIPTRSVVLSQTAEHPVPYTVWDLTAEAPGYDSVIVHNIAVFPGVVTTQSFSMKPSAESIVPHTDEIYATAKKRDDYGMYKS